MKEDHAITLLHVSSMQEGPGMIRLLQFNLMMADMTCVCFDYIQNSKKIKTAKCF
jgi:hypothetical protein